MDSIMMRFDVSLSRHNDGLVVNDAPPSILLWDIGYQQTGHLYLVPRREIATFFGNLVACGYSFAYDPD